MNSNTNCIIIFVLEFAHPIPRDLFKKRNHWLKLRLCTNVSECALSVCSNAMQFSLCTFEILPFHIYKQRRKWRNNERMAIIKWNSLVSRRRAFIVIMHTLAFSSCLHSSFTIHYFSVYSCHIHLWTFLFTNATILSFSISLSLYLFFLFHIKKISKSIVFCLDRKKDNGSFFRLSWEAFAQGNIGKNMNFHAEDAFYLMSILYTDIIWSMKRQYFHFPRKL